MLTPQQLERASLGFRRGYRAAREGKPFEPTGAQGTFIYTDYCDGYIAGRNEREWEAKRKARLPVASKPN